MSLTKLTDRLLQKFVRDPAGYGRPAPAAAFDQEYQSGRWDHLSAFAELPRHLVLAGAIHHFFPENPAVLDIGCGNGRFAQTMGHYPFSSYLGVDLSGEAVARARILGLPRMAFVAGDYESWRPPGRFEAIVFNESIGYARDPAATLSAFAPYLQPGGRFFLSLYRSGSYAPQWRRLARVAQVEESTTITDATGEKKWDIRILAPRP